VGVGGKARTGEQGGQQVATHPLSRFVTLGAPSAPCPVLVMALPLECVCAFFFACVSFPMMCHDAHAALAGEGGEHPRPPCRAERWTDCSDDHALWTCWN
jgi:hypothetical protein